MMRIPRFTRLLTDATPVSVFARAIVRPTLFVVVIRNERSVATSLGCRAKISMSPTAASLGGGRQLSYFWKARLPPPMMTPAYPL